MRQVFAGLKNVGWPPDDCVRAEPWVRAGYSVRHRSIVRVPCVLRRLVVDGDEPDQIVVTSVRVGPPGALRELNIGEGPMPTSAFRAGYSPQQVVFAGAEEPITFNEPLNAGDVIEVDFKNLDGYSGHTVSSGAVVQIEGAGRAPSVAEGDSTAVRQLLADEFRECAPCAAKPGSPV